MERNHRDSFERCTVSLSGPEAAHMFQSWKKKKKKKGGVPDRWLDYQPVGRRLPGTRFIAFKVPLSPSLNGALAEPDRFGFWDLLEAVEGQNQELGLIIDLTFTHKYYTPTQVPPSCSYVKILTRGHRVPSDAVILSFKRAVRRFLKLNRDNERLIGVHCTHGLNRTGYLVCRYLVDVDGLAPPAAVALFDSCRGHPMERQNYLQDLHCTPPRSNAGMDRPKEAASGGLAEKRPPSISAAGPEHRPQQTARKEGRQEQTARKEGRQEQTARKEGRQEQTARKEGRQEQTDRKEGRQEQTDRKEGRQEQTDRKEGRQEQTARKEGRQEQTARKEGRQEQTARKEGRQEQTTRKEGRQEQTARKEGRQEQTARKEGRQEQTARKEGRQEQTDRKEGRQEQTAKSTSGGVNNNGPSKQTKRKKGQQPWDQTERLGGQNGFRSSQQFVKKERLGVSADGRKQKAGKRRQRKPGRGQKPESRSSSRPPPTAPLPRYSWNTAMATEAPPTL